MKLYRFLAAWAVMTFAFISLGATEMDPHSFAQPEKVSVTHLDLDLSVDFAKRQLRGTATLHLENKAECEKLVLDTRGLNIEAVTLDGGEATTFQLGESVPILGQALEVGISPTSKTVTVTYSTSPQAEALQWLTPAQTTGGKHPFLFTQSQAILARTWIPCQDTPSVRMTYRALVRVPKELMAVMSAENGQNREKDGTYVFKMEQPIPSYLMALAVGDLQFQPLGRRAGIYAEPSVVTKAAWEFADTEKMMAAAEKLYGPYRWGRYDILVLPPSFPYGGMENPRLTFVTPTLMAGDRSLVAVVAHELAHSWSGNLVTNATWNDFWLNEGFTMYFEHRLTEEIYGTQAEAMQAVLDLGDLHSCLSELGPDSPDTALRLNLKGRDPDEACNDIAYIKGLYFLRTIEAAVGRERWDAFVRDYFDRFAFQAMNTDRFLAHLRSELIKGDEKLEAQLQISAWVDQPGIPDNIVTVESDQFQLVEQRIAEWQQGAVASDLNTEEWTTQHWVHFLRTLPAALSIAQMEDLDAAFEFTRSGNAEITQEWMLRVIQTGYEPGYTKLRSFLSQQGRRKYLKPLYQKLAETPEGKKLAEDIYSSARDGYHPVAVGTVDALLGV